MSGMSLKMTIEPREAGNVEGNTLNTSVFEFGAHTPSEFFEARDRAEKATRVKGKREEIIQHIATFDEVADAIDEEFEGRRGNTEGIKSRYNNYLRKLNDRQKKGIDTLVQEALAVVNTKRLNDESYDQSRLQVLADHGYISSMRLSKARTPEEIIALPPEIISKVRELEEGITEYILSQIERIEKLYGFYNSQDVENKKPLESINELSLNGFISVQDQTSGKIERFVSKGVELGYIQDQTKFLTLSVDQAREILRELQEQLAAMNKSRPYEIKVPQQDIDSIREGTEGEVEAVTK